MEHYRLRDRRYPEIKIDKKVKWLASILGFSIGIIFSLIISVLIGFFPGGILTIFLMTIDYTGVCKIGDFFIMLPWVSEGLLVFIICFGSVISAISENLRR